MGDSINSLILLVPRSGFEPLTCPLGGGRSIQLSYRSNISATCCWAAKHAVLQISQAGPDWRRIIARGARI